MRSSFSKSLVIAAVALTTAACVPPARPAGQDESSDKPAASGTLSDKSRPEADPAVPSPPAPDRSPLARATIGVLKAGPRICAAPRPDLARVMIQWEPAQAGARPEELYLIQQFLIESWRREMPQVDARLWPKPCNEALLCASFRPSEARAATAALVRSLSTRTQAAFYAVRSEALGNAEDWDQSAPGWKLSTGSMFAMSAPPALSRLASLTPPATSSQWEAAIRKETGSAYLARVPLYAVEKKIEALVAHSTITIVGPSSRDVLGELELNLEPQLASTNTQEERAGAPRPLSHNAPIPMEKDAGHRSYAQLTWALPANAPLFSVEIALQLIVDRWDAAHRGSSRARVIPHGGLVPLPVIRLDGPHEEVLAALSEMSSNHDALVSASLAPSEAEWARARGRAVHAKSLDPRCALQSISMPDDAVGALRKAGAPLSMIWGTDAPETTSEDAPD